MNAGACYPLRFRPLIKAKVWGGRRLEAFGKELPPDVLVGESWEVADLASTSPSGGGGGEARSVIVNGELAGRTLAEALDSWGEDLLGDASPAPGGGFPLLVKFLDAREHLSVQVHPSPTYAAKHPDAHVKDECWYVLRSEPGSVIFKGLVPGVTREELARAIRSGTVPDRLVAMPAVPGDCHELPSGTIHALGAGVLVAEVQTPSDTTFRVYDWTKEYERAPRELHVGPALECADLRPAPDASSRPDHERAARLVSTRSFHLWECRAPALEATTVPGEGSGFAVLIVVSGRLRLLSAGGEFPETDLEIGDTVLVPAAVRAAARVLGAEAARLLCAVPSS